MENWNTKTSTLPKGSWIFMESASIPVSAKGKMINALRLAMEFEALMPSDQRPECTEGREGFIHLDALQGSVDHARSEYIIRDHDMDLFQAKKKHMEDMARTMNAKYGYEAVTPENPGLLF